MNLAVIPFVDVNLHRYKNRKRLIKKQSATAFYNVVYAKDLLDKLSCTEKGFEKFEPEQLVSLVYLAGFENVKIKDVVNSQHVLKKIALFA